MVQEGVRPRGRTVVVLLCGALVGSLTLNIALAFLARGTPGAPGSTSASSERATDDEDVTGPSEDSRAPSTSVAPDYICGAALSRCTEACRNAGGPTLAPTALVTQPTKDASAAMREREALALCRVAEGALRERWSAEVTAATHALAADYSDTASQQRKAHEAVGRIARSLDLTLGEADELEAAYDPVRVGHAGRIGDALQQVPPDYETALRETKGMFADEDALIQRLDGDDRVARWRDANLEARTTRLAMLATFATPDWDAEAISW
jgi:hypothetical protein